MKVSIYDIKVYLREQDWVVDIDMIPYSKVPLIRFTDNITKISVDITMNNLSGVKGLKIINE